MNVFYAISGKKIKRIVFLITTLMFASAIIFVERNNVTVFSYEEPTAIYGVTTDRKVMALTFDVSWGDRSAEAVLDTLKEKGVNKATFFISSPWSRQHPGIAEKIAEEGFEIGSHGHKHEDYTTFNNEEIRKQLSIANQIIAEVTGTQPKLVRMPNGDYDKRVLQEANRLGLTVISWDIDALDDHNPGVDNIVGRVVAEAHPGGIIRMNASDSAEQTPLALPKLIDELHAKGYTLVTVSELINNTSLDAHEVRDNR